MKPIIIYSLPRARSTVILQSCKRDNILHEPIEGMQLFPGEHVRSFRLYPYYSNSILGDRWESLKAKMNDPNTATKFFGTSLHTCYPARKWFKEVDEANTHDIFVPIRDRREQAISYILANKFGWVKRGETKPFECEIDDLFIYYLAERYDDFLRFFPKNGIYLDFNNMPESHFDISRSVIEDQESYTKLKYIKNLDFVMDQIDHVIKCFDEEWNEKISTLRRL